MSQRRRVSWRHALILLGRVRLARSDKTTTYWVDLYLARSDKTTTYWADLYLARSDKTTTYWADLYLARSDKNCLLV